MENTLVNCPYCYRDVTLSAKDLGLDDPCEHLVWANLYIHDPKFHSPGTDILELDGDHWRHDLWPEDRFDECSDAVDAILRKTADAPESERKVVRIERDIPNDDPLAKDLYVKAEFVFAKEAQAFVREMSD